MVRAEAYLFGEAEMVDDEGQGFPVELLVPGRVEEAVEPEGAQTAVSILGSVRQVLRYIQNVCEQNDRYSIHIRAHSFFIYVLWVMVIVVEDFTRAIVQGGVKIQYLIDVDDGGR